MARDLTWRHRHQRALIGPDIVNDLVLRSGQTLDNEIVFNVILGREGLNNHGDLTFIVQFSGGHAAIYRATPVPEPAAATGALLIGAIGLTARRRSRRRR